MLLGVTSRLADTGRVALAEAVLAGRFLGGSLSRAAKVLVSSPPFFPTWAHS